MHPLISADDLHARLGDPALRIVDTRFDLADPAAGRRAYAAAHLPGAVHLDLDHDLSLPLAERGEHGGRHPLPEPGALARRLGELGIGDEHRVVAYDASGGLFAGRLWWLLRWLGHDAVQVLDGGLSAWEDAGGKLTTAPPNHPPATFRPRPDAGMVAERGELLRRLGDPTLLLVDARAAPRYRGESEPLDARAGHIPSALNRPFADNLDGPLVEGRFRDAAALRADFGAAEEVLEIGGEVVLYCGSGVSAAHNAIAMVAAGLPLPRLYVGSWSDWSSYPDAPVADGDEADPTGASAAAPTDG